MTRWFRPSGPPHGVWSGVNLLYFIGLSQHQKRIPKRPQKLQNPLKGESSFHVFLWLRGGKCSNQSFKLATGLMTTPAARICWQSGLEAKETSNTASAFSVSPTPLAAEKLEKYTYAYLRKGKLLGCSELHRRRHSLRKFLNHGSS